MATSESNPQRRVHSQYSFSSFTLDLDAGFLYRGAEQVPLRPKPFALLVYLVERHGQLVTKPAIARAVWPDTAVMDNTLAQCVVEIRRTLGDDSQQLIRTVAGRGYVFAGPVTTPVAEFPHLPEGVRPVVVEPSATDRERARLTARWYLPAAGALILLAMGIVGYRWIRPARRDTGLTSYTQLTNFTDSAVAPALSPDGRFLAFIRSAYPFGGEGQVYVKLLPGGEPAQLTHDNLNKRGSPQFSPDGSLIAYAAYQHGAGWSTWVVPVFGGEPRPLLANAQGLSWIQAGTGQSRLMYSEMTGRGDQLAVYTSTESRTQRRAVYMPPETGMAHRSYLSPDRKHVLLAEMDQASWLPCRLVPFGDNSPLQQPTGAPVGPAPAQCTDAAWSPDGAWMYFSANTGSGFHMWRQRFPDGVPQQITSGATQEEGVAFAPDGRSFVASVGTSQSEVWIHDSNGDRQITSEGYGLLPSISPDGRKLYYLMRTAGLRTFLGGELWIVDLDSGQRQRLLPDFQMQHYSISADGRGLIFVAAHSESSPVWRWDLDGRSPPRQIAGGVAWMAYPVAGGYVIFSGEEQRTQFIYRVKNDGSELRKVLRIDVPSSLLGASPDGKWVALTGVADDTEHTTMLYPVDGGEPRRLCKGCNGGNAVERIGPPAASWSSDGKFLNLKFPDSIYAIPLAPGQMLPPIPSSGFQSKEDVAAIPGARLISQDGAFPGPNPSFYAFTKVTTHRNIYRIAVP